MKLVRDNIIDIMTAEGKEPKFRRLYDNNTVNTYVKEELTKFVTDKLKEEFQEMLEAPGRHHLMEEMGDLLTVMQKYAEINGIGWDRVLAAQEGKNAVKGKFDHNLILENEEELCPKK
jgi:predicted house-cleaning noncanonical NTP pyrophosphatase (MazG superfamily)